MREVAQIVLKPCPVTHHEVCCQSDLEGTVSAVLCPEFVRSTRACRAKTHLVNEGPLAQLLQRVDQHALDSHSNECVLVE